MSGETLRAARKKADKSLDQLSELTGISVSQLSRFESEQRRPRVDEVILISEALNVSVLDIYPELAQQASSAVASKLAAMEGVLLALGLEADQAAELTEIVDAACKAPLISGERHDEVLRRRDIAFHEASKFLQARRARKAPPKL